jgi:hypothetical protein
VWGSEDIPPPFLTSALDGGEWSASWPGRFTQPGETAPRYPLDRRLGGPHRRSWRNGEEKNIASAGNRTPVVQPVARCNTVSAISVLCKMPYYENKIVSHIALNISIFQIHIRHDFMRTMEKACKKSILTLEEWFVLSTARQLILKAFNQRKTLHTEQL